MNEVHQALALLASLQLKHFVFDWWLQTDSEIRHKGTYLNVKGVAHSVKHALGTMALVWFFFPDWAILTGVYDGFVHYHIDWAKQNLTRKLALTTSDENFWFLIGLDQLLHQLTYLSIVLALN